jgi:hypothetical protein
MESGLLWQIFHAHPLVSLTHITKGVNMEQIGNTIIYVGVFLAITIVIYCVVLGIKYPTPPSEE